MAISDGRTAVQCVDLSTGLVSTVTSEPMPGGGVTYGGGLFATSGDLLVLPARDGRLWRLDRRTGDQRPITPPLGGVGGPVLSACGRFVACAAEADASGLVMIAPVDGESFPVKLPGSLSFAGDVCLGPRGQYCAWQTWPERQMPWDHAELRIARFAKPLSDCRDLNEAFPVRVDSVVRPGVHLSFPLAHPDGRTLLFTSDETGWRQPWQVDLGSGQLRRVAQVEGEVGAPNWVLRSYPMALGQGGARLYAITRQLGLSTLVAIDLATGAVAPINVAAKALHSLACYDAGTGGVDRLAWCGSDPVTPATLVTRELGADLEVSQERVRATSAVGVWDPSRLSTPVTVSWNASDGTEVWAVWTPALGEQRAPVIVLIHGGPTAAAEFGWDATAQYYATRGYHVLAVNHRGSTQRGRAYQDALKGNWGEMDVEDARAGAQALVDRGAADPERTAIMGGSAGGYTTLMALATQPEFWAAGISLYGVGDLYEVMRGSHRFEKYYEHTLVGALPEAGALWVQRSPLTHAHRVRAPVLLFHGAQDKAVPVRQSIEFAEAVRSRRGQVEIVTYDDEGHGFKHDKTRREVLERSLAFLDKYVKNRQFVRQP